MRDGISLTQARKLKPNLIPSEVTQLNDLEGFIRLPGNWPVARVKLTFRAPMARVPAYLPATTPRVWPPAPSRTVVSAPTISGDLFLDPMGSLEAGSAGPPPQAAHSA